MTPSWRQIKDWPAPASAAGRVASDLIRRALTQPVAVHQARQIPLGFQPFRPRTASSRVSTSASTACGTHWAVMRALLDVNVLVALLDAGHIRRATGQADAQYGIDARATASTPLTQIGCLRLLSLPTWPRPQPLRGGRRRATAQSDAHGSPRVLERCLSVLDSSSHRHALVAHRDPVGCVPAGAGGLRREGAVRHVRSTGVRPATGARRGPRHLALI